MANKALFWYNYKRFVDEGTIKPLSPKTFALSGLITVCGLVLSLTIYCLVFPNSFVGENTPIKLFFCTLFYMLGTLAMIGGVYFGISLVVTRFIPDKLCNISGQCKSAVMCLYALQARANLEYQITRKFGIYATGGYGLTRFYNKSSNYDKGAIIEAGSVLF